MEQRLTRREFLILSSSGLIAAGALGPEALFAQTTTIRQGFQTNIWGMPTYYLLRSGALEKRGLKFEDYQEVKMDVNEMVAAAAAKAIDAFVSVDPYCSIAEAEGIATTVVSLYDYDPMPVFMAATPEFVEKNPQVVVEYLRAWL